MIKLILLMIELEFQIISFSKYSLIAPFSETWKHKSHGFVLVYAKKIAFEYKNGILIKNQSLW